MTRRGLTPGRRGRPPIPRALAFVDIPDIGTVEGNGNTDTAVHHAIGCDAYGKLWLTYWVWEKGRFRISSRDPRWNPFHAKRYIRWRTAP